MLARRLFVVGWCCAVAFLALLRICSSDSWLFVNNMCARPFVLLAFFLLSGNDVLWPMGYVSSCPSVLFLFFGRLVLVLGCYCCVCVRVCACVCVCVCSSVCCLVVVILSCLLWSSVCCLVVVVRVRLCLACVLYVIVLCSLNDFVLWTQKQTAQRLLDGRQ